MCPVNFGILQPIQAPQVVANLPQQSGNNALANLGSGLNSAVQNMQGVQLNNLQIEKAQIGVDEAKAEQAKRRTYDEIVKTSNGNFEAYIKAVAKVDPLIAMDAMTKRQQIQNLMEQTRGNKAAADKTEMSNSNEYWAAIGDLASATMNLTKPDGTPFDPQTKAAYFNKGLTFFPDTVKQGLKKIAPEGFTDSNAMVLITEGAIAQASMSKGKSVAPSDTKKRLDEVNQARVAAGQAPLTPQEQAATLEKGLGTSISPNKMVADPIDSGLAKMQIAQVQKYAADAEGADEALAMSANFRALNAKFPTGFGAVPKLQVQQAYEALTGNKLESTKFGEAMQSGAMDFVMKRIAGTKGAISEKEMEAFAKASPGMRNSQQGNEVILNLLDATEMRKKEKAEMAQAYLEQKRTMKGFDAEWKKYVDENPIIDPKTLQIINPKYKSKAAQATAQQGAPGGSADPLGIR